jgi:hypothetical protein
MMILQQTTAQCIHHPNAEQQKQQLKRDAFHEYISNGWTLKIMDEYRKNTRPERPSNLIDVLVRQRDYSGEKSCRKNRIITPDSDIHTLSTCPWYYVIDFDSQREPQIVSKAKCSCKRCFTVDRGGKSRDMCREINSFIPVIKWRCPNNYTGNKPYYFQYYLDYEAVPVGCTCQRPFKIV